MSEKMLGTTKISSKGQVTVPVDARKKFQIETGDRLVFIDKDGELVLRKG